LNDGDVDILETESAVTTLAIEMGMLISNRAGTVVVAHPIFEGTAAIVDAVDKFMSEEEGNSPRDRRLVDSIVQEVLQIE
jgi:hypothetical protein